MAWPAISAPVVETMIAVVAAAIATARESPAEGVEEGAPGRRKDRNAHVAGQGHESESAERHVESQGERKACLVRTDELQEIGQVRNGWQAHRLSLVKQRVPEAQLAPFQSIEGEEAQREELTREVSEEKSVTCERAAQEGKESHHRYRQPGQQRPSAVREAGPAHQQGALRRARCIPGPHSTGTSSCASS
jgi:hypothetical protein